MARVNAGRRNMKLHPPGVLKRLHEWELNPLGTGLQAAVNPHRPLALENPRTPYHRWQGPGAYDGGAGEI